MADSNFTLNFGIKSTLDNKGLEQLSQGLDRANQSVSKAKVAMQVLTGVAGGALVGALSDAAKAGADEAASLLRVQTAVDNTGTSFASQKTSIDAVIESGRQLGFTHIELNDSFALLVEQTGSAETAMERMKVAENLARGAHIDLYTASKLLGKATDENANVLGRYGIKVEKGADVTTMLAEVQAKFGGQAAAYGASTSGAIDRIHSSIEEWRAGIGNALGPAQAFVAVLPGLRSGMELWTGALVPAVTNLGGLRAATTNLLSALNPVTLATKAWSVAQLALNLVMSANPIAIVVLAIAGLVVAVKLAYDHFEGFRRMVDALFAFLKNVFGPVLGVIGGIFEGLGKLVGGTSAEMRSDVTSDFSAMQESASGSMQTLHTNATAAAKATQTDVAAALQKMKDAGVENTNLMSADSILATMGMSTEIRNTVAEMATGVIDKTSEERDQIIFAMQDAKLQAAQRAAGMSEDVIAAIDKMVFDSRTSEETMRVQHAEKFDAMKAKSLELRDSMREAASGVDGLRASIDQLHDKTVNVTVNTVGGGQSHLMAAGGDFLVTRPTVFVAGEAGPERATFTPIGGGGRGGDRDGGGGGDMRPVHVWIDGQRLMELVGAATVDQARAAGRSL